MKKTKEKIIILGAGGHAKVLVELIKEVGEYDIYGILAPKETSASFCNVPILGDDTILREIYNKGIKKACIGIGSVRDNTKRIQLYERVKEYGFNVPALVHPRAIVSLSAKIMEGAQIMAGVIIQADAFIGNNTIINTGAIIEHDCKVGKHIHVCPGSVLSGACEVGDGTFVGAGSILIHGIKIGWNACVGAGSVVIRDIKEGVLVKGVPAK
ncbi:Sialic acid O-acyltransferase, NeuD [Candidatus Omnitrophus magneticus]|uniref:Sialic acid O-acyltransferase, NeuD n=1 Tax=Candidatus Omnitrophus magneticus TaxID=1609969 RepID=A0A0F0CNN3_9BACT|nr:Sialic acid O-acyltransferase, NeuD [Candidatus Omnitrophus magneticus]